MPPLAEIKLEKTVLGSFLTADAKSSARLVVYEGSPDTWLLGGYSTLTLKASVAPLVSGVAVMVGTMGATKLVMAVEMADSKLLASALVDAVVVSRKLTVGCSVLACSSLRPVGAGGL